MTSPVDAAPASRVIVLGASNISLGWKPLTRTILQRSRRPVHLAAAYGMGRSYLGVSRFGMRSIPGILDSGLWEEMKSCSDPPPQDALITDLGNDLVYGSRAAEVVQAAADAVGRIRDMNPDCRIVVTRPPLESVLSLSSLRFRLFRTVLFPLSRLTLASVLEGAHELDEGIQQLSGITTVAPQPEWYGFDPIHVLRRFRESAFQSYLASWQAVDSDDQPAVEAPVPRATAGIRRVLGRRVECPQPSVITPDITVSSW